MNYITQKVLPEASPYAYPPRFEKIGTYPTVTATKTAAEAAWPSEDRAAAVWREIPGDEDFPHTTHVFEQPEPSDSILPPIVLAIVCSEKAERRMKSDEEHYAKMDTYSGEKLPPV
jgi:hypothetical protein